jgi:GWxTD domain-containing protein
LKTVTHTLIGLFWLLFFDFSVLKSQNFAYGSMTCFNIPDQQAFIESYLTIVGNLLSSKEVNGAYQSSVKVSVNIKGDSGFVLNKEYNVLSPVYSNSLQAPSFIDVQRYPLKNGNYTVFIKIDDNNNPFKKPFEFRKKFSINYQAYQLQNSGIELLERFQKTDIQNNLSKSGYEMIPYTVNYYPESQTQLLFYFETYHSDTILGKNKSLVYTYYLQNAQNSAKLNEYGSFKKQKTAKVNPLLGKLDITKLPTGSYYLVIELRDENNILHISEKLQFQRMNTIQTESKPNPLVEKNTFIEFFENRNNPDSLKMFVECLWPIADGLDKERIINTAVKKDPVLMKNFVTDFWQRRASDSANPYKMWSKYYTSVMEAMVLFRCGKQPGYSGDRGRVYLQYGKPNQRTIENYEPNTFPYEIWQYYRTTDASTGRYYSNRKFVFVNRALGDDCHQLIHSDMPGEFNNPRWQFDITRRNNEGKADLENQTPNGTQFNQFNEIYSNPR